MTSGKKYRRHDHPNSDPRKLKAMRKQRDEKRQARRPRLGESPDEWDERTAGGTR